MKTFMNIIMKILQTHRVLKFHCVLQNYFWRNSTDSDFLWFFLYLGEQRQRNKCDKHLYLGL